MMDYIRQLLAAASELIAIPLRAATSKTAQRAYLGTVIFGIIASILFGVSTLSFLVFYNIYIPEIGIERPLHLQFGQGHPFARTNLGGGLTSNQPYDISVTLVLPRTPANVATGNFMLDLALLPPNTSQIERMPIIQQILDISVSPIAVSRRPAILTYKSPVVDLAQTLGRLPLYTLGLKTQRETVEVSMFEGVEFSRGTANVPDRVQLVIEADEKMQFYSASVNLHAKFQGLRWILYNYRITSFLVFTTTFFIVSLVSTVSIYVAFSFGTSPGGKRIKKEIKTEPMESIQAGKQQPQPVGLSAAPSIAEVVVKKEDFESLESSDIPPLGGEADDEDEDDENYDGNTSGWRDSGIGSGRDLRDASGRKRRSYNN